MNSVWWKVWLEACHEFLGCEDTEPVITSDIVQLANQTELKEVDVVSFKELLHSHREDNMNCRN